MRSPNTSKGLQVYLFRHVQSKKNLQPHIICGRSNETEISETGYAQGTHLGLHAKDTLPKPNYVYSSPAVRAKKTGIIMLDLAFPDHKFEIIEDDRLQELDQGDAEGRLRSDVYTQEVLDRIAAEKLDFKHAGGQSPNELAQSGLDWLQYVHDRHAAEDAVIYAFTHGMFTKALVGNITNMEYDQMYELYVPNTSYTKISGEPGNWNVDILGHTDHIQIETN